MDRVVGEIEVGDAEDEGAKDQRATVPQEVDAIEIMPLPEGDRR